MKILLMLAVAAWGITAMILKILYTLLIVVQFRFGIFPQQDVSQRRDAWITWIEPKGVRKWYEFPAQYGVRQNIGAPCLAYGFKYNGPVFCRPVVWAYEQGKVPYRLSISANDSRKK